MNGGEGGILFRRQSLNNFFTLRFTVSILYTYMKISYRQNKLLNLFNWAKLNLAKKKINIFSYYCCTVFN